MSSDVLQYTYSIHSFGKPILNQHSDDMFFTHASPRLENAEPPRNSGKKPLGYSPSRGDEVRGGLFRQTQSTHAAPD